MVALTFDGMFFIIVIFHCCRLNFRAAATVLSFYGAFTTIKEKKKKKTAHKEIFIVRRSQGHMQVNFIVSFYETAANYFSFFRLFVLACCFCFVYVFVCFICLFFFSTISQLLVSRDATKIQTKKLSILPGFYFHDALEQLKTNFHTKFCFKRVLGFVIECA